MSNDKRMLYSRTEAAHQLSISTRTLDYLISQKQLRFRRIGRKVLIPHAEMVRFASGDHYDSPSRSAGGHV